MPFAPNVSSGIRKIVNAVALSFGDEGIDDIRSRIDPARNEIIKAEPEQKPETTPVKSAGFNERIVVCTIPDTDWNQPTVERDM